MSQLLQEVGNNSKQAGLTLVALSFAYGVLHALGPGHGKVVITTYLATNPSRLRSSVRLTLAASLLQGLVAIALVSGVLGVLQLSTRYLHQSSFWLEKASYLLVVVLGAILCWRALRKVLALRRRTPSTPLQISAIKPLNHKLIKSTGTRLTVVVGINMWRVMARLRRRRPGKRSLPL